MISENPITEGVGTARACEILAEELRPGGEPYSHKRLEQIRDHALILYSKAGPSRGAEVSYSESSLRAYARAQLAAAEEEHGERGKAKRALEAASAEHSAAVEREAVLAGLQTQKRAELAELEQASSQPGFLSEDFALAPLSGESDRLKRELTAIEAERVHWRGARGPSRTLYCGDMDRDQFRRLALKQGAVLAADGLTAVIEGAFGGTGRAGWIKVLEAREKIALAAVKRVQALATTPPSEEIISPAQIKLFLAAHAARVEAEQARREAANLASLAQFIETERRVDAVRARGGSKAQRDAAHEAQALRMAVPEALEPWQIIVDGYHVSIRVEPLTAAAAAAPGVLNSKRMAERERRAQEHAALAAEIRAGSSDGPSEQESV